MEPKVGEGGRAVLARAEMETFGFLRAEDVEALAADPETRLEPLLVRCGASRFWAPAQCVSRLIRLVEATGEEYVRDVSVPVARPLLVHAAPDLLRAAQRVLAALEWEERRSGTTYAGYDDLKRAVAKATRESGADD